MAVKNISVLSLKQPNKASSVRKLQDGGSCQFKGKKEKLNTHK